MPIKDARGEGWYDIFQNIKEGQINVSTTLPGVVRAFHRHVNQTDSWKVISGELEVCLVSPLGETSFYYLNKYSDVLNIFPNYWHGFRVLGNEPATLLYYVNTRYNPLSPDEQRAAWNAFYDWQTRNY